MTGVTIRSREVAPGIFWLVQCLVSPTVGNHHVHQSAYLILGSERALLYDTSAPGQWIAVSHELDRLLGERSLDIIVPSHPEVPHCGNVSRLLRKYPGAMVVGDVRDYHVYYPSLVDRFTAMEKEVYIDLGGGKEFVLLDAIIRDLPSTRWGYETSEGVLFVADAFAFSHHPAISDDDGPAHLPGECSLLSSEMCPPTHDQIAWVTKAGLFWIQYVKIDAYLKQVEALLQKYPASLVAPAHGSVIDNVDVVLPVVADSLRRAYYAGALSGP
jgi:flavorubredoxin